MQQFYWMPLRLVRTSRNKQHLLPILLWPSERKRHSSSRIHQLPTRSQPLHCQFLWSCTGAMPLLQHLQPSFWNFYQLCWQHWSEQHHSGMSETFQWQCNLQNLQLRSKHWSLCRWHFNLCLSHWPGLSRWIWVHNQHLWCDKEPVHQHSCWLLAWCFEWRMHYEQQLYSWKYWTDFLGWKLGFRPHQYW